MSTDKDNRDRAIGPSLIVGVSGVGIDDPGPPGVAVGLVGDRCQPVESFIIKLDRYCWIGHQV